MVQQRGRRIRYNIPVTIQQQAAEILTFWFGELDTDGFSVTDKNKLWFGSSTEDDKDIERRFAPLIAAAIAGELGEWEQAGDGENMALILLTDQMTRAVYRGSRKAFAGDARARRVCKNGITDGLHLRLPPIWRIFYYLPLEHSESPADQLLCVEQFNLLLQAFPAHQARLAAAADYARLHHDIIKQFGRFPHRNTILDRDSTEAELDYLNKTGQHFGQKPAK